jgi:hypothetical protein
MISGVWQLMDPRSSRRLIDEMVVFGLVHLVEAESNGQRGLEVSKDLLNGIWNGPKRRHFRRHALAPPSTLGSSVPGGRRRTRVTLFPRSLK